MGGENLGLMLTYCRIGIHTGKALVGNLGSAGMFVCFYCCFCYSFFLFLRCILNLMSAERLAFTAVGDNINLGARLESLNKKYGTSVSFVSSSLSFSYFPHFFLFFLFSFMDVVSLLPPLTVADIDLRRSVRTSEGSFPL